MKLSSGELLLSGEGLPPFRVSMQYSVDSVPRAMGASIISESLFMVMLPRTELSSVKTMGAPTMYKDSSS